VATTLPPGRPGAAALELVQAFDGSRPATYSWNKADAIVDELIGGGLSVMYNGDFTDTDQSPAFRTV